MGSSTGLCHFEQSEKSLKLKLETVLPLSKEHSSTLFHKTNHTDFAIYSGRLRRHLYPIQKPWMLSK